MIDFGGNSYHITLGLGLWLGLGLGLGGEQTIHLDTGSAHHVCERQQYVSISVSK